VLGITQHQTLFDAALPQAGLDLGGDIDECTPGGDFEPELFAVAFHFSPFGIRLDRLDGLDRYDRLI